MAKQYLLVELDSRDESLQDLRQAVADMLEPGDNQHITVSVLELKDVFMTNKSPVVTTCSKCATPRRDPEQEHPGVCVCGGFLTDSLSAVMMARVAE